MPFFPENKEKRIRATYQLRCKCGAYRDTNGRSSASVSIFPGAEVLKYNLEVYWWGVLIGVGVDGGGGNFSFIFIILINIMIITIINIYFFFGGGGGGSFVLFFSAHFFIFFDCFSSFSFVFHLLRFTSFFNLLYFWSLFSHSPRTRATNLKFLENEEFAPTLFKTSRALFVKWWWLGFLTFFSY